MTFTAPPAPPRTAAPHIPDEDRPPSDLHCFPVDAIVRFVFHLGSKGLVWPPVALTDTLISASILILFKMVPTT